MSEESPRSERDLMIAVFSVSAGLTGVCLTGIGLLRVVTTVRRVSLWSDNLLAVDAVFFVASCLLAFVSLRGEAAAHQARLRRWADGIFFVGLVLMAAICSVIAYELI